MEFKDKTRFVVSVVRRTAESYFYIVRTGCISSYNLPKNGTIIRHVSIKCQLIIRNVSYLAAVSCKCCPRAPEVSRETVLTTEQEGVRSPALSRATSVPVTVNFVK